MDSVVAGRTGYYTEESCDLAEFATLTARQVSAVDVPSATTIEASIPIYDAQSLNARYADAAARQTLMTEWAWVLHSGPGVFVLQQAQPDHDAIDEATRVYSALIETEKLAGRDGADHFAAAGSNDRLWNSLQKLAQAAPATFVRYFACPAIDAVCEAWLGPGYQLTAQINLIYPGGQAQQAHRDYHLGFQTAASCARYPAHVHDLSPLMTLQGALAHCDMPVESGPTKLLPYSQLYRAGYAAMRRQDFRSHFNQHSVQLALEKGDAVFFSPALFHAAGDNRTTDVNRMANLMQIGSPFGRTLENVDRVAMCNMLYEPLLSAWRSDQLKPEQLDAVIAACAEGYPFPTNLDRDPPVDGLAPDSQAVLMRRAMTQQMAFEDFRALIDAQQEKKQT